MQVLIVDDEPLACERIRTLLADAPDVTIAGEYHDGRTAAAAIRKLAPDIVFLDVQMPEMDGFQVLQSLALQNLDAASLPVIVFVTAFDQYAIKAFDVCALDYLLKPFDRERFQQALERGRTELARRATGHLDQRLRGALEAWQKREQYTSRLVIKSGGRVFFLRVQEIDWIEACGNYVQLHAGGQKHLHRETMARMEAALDPALFARIHRSTIVNVERIKELQPLFRGDYTVILRGGQELTLGRAYRARLSL
jgi:two-component system LytT family response regulator